MKKAGKGHGALPSLVQVTDPCFLFSTHFQVLQPHTRSCKALFLYPGELQPWELEQDGCTSQNKEKNPSPHSRMQTDISGILLHYELLRFDLNSFGFDKTLVFAEP